MLPPEVTSKCHLQNFDARVQIIGYTNMQVLLYNKVKNYSELGPTEQKSEMLQLIRRIRNEARKENTWQANWC